MTNETPITRDKLIDDVQQGKLTPGEAEAKARRNGLGPLEYQPPIESSNPMLEPDWSLPMAVAWIRDQSPAAVTMEWDAFRKKCRDWVARFDNNGKTIGNSLQTRSGAKLFWIAENAVAAAPAPGKQLSQLRADRLLWNALGEGKVRATAVTLVDNRRVEIQSTEWQDLRPVRYGSAEALGNRQPIYIDCTVRRQDVMKEWPAPEAGSLAALGAITFNMTFGLKQVEFQHVIKIHGASYELFECLHRRVLHTRADGQVPYTSSLVLANELSIDEDSVQRRVSRFRSEVAKGYLSNFAVKLAKDAVIQGRRNSGYRINSALKEWSPSA